MGLCEQFAVHSITRVYEAVVYGGFSEDDGAVEGLIGRSPKDRKKMAVVAKNGKYAYTSYHVEQRFSGFTHISARLKTGQCLHAGTLGFVHPCSGVYMEFTSGLPAYFQSFLQELAQEWS